MLVAAVAILLTAAILWYWTGRHDRRLLDQIPAPPTLPVIGLLPEVLCSSAEFFKKMKNWATELGPVVFLRVPSLNQVILSGPEEIQVVLNDQETLSKGKSYDFLQPWLGTSLLTAGERKWRSLRRMLTPAFHYKILENFVPVFNANSAILVAKMRKHTSDEYIEIEDYVSLCTLDSVCETVMGTSANAQMGEVEYIRAVKRMCDLFYHRHLSPWIHSDLIYQLTPSRREEKRVVKVLQDFSGNIIKKRRSEFEKTKANVQQDDDECKRRLSLLDLLLEMSNQKGKLTDDEIREEVDTFMFAGHDTTAAAISWALFLLGAHQDIQDKVVAELSEIFGSDQRHPTEADLQKMTYLDMVIKEALRLYPSVPAYTRFTSSYLKLGKYTIPPRNTILISAFIVHMNPDIYPDPERFDPERFSPEQSSGRHPYAYIPFSAGPRNCIGLKFARIQQKCVLSSILRNLKLESLDYENVQSVPNIVLKSKDPLKIKISVREL